MTGARPNDQGGHTFTRETLKRLRRLNASHGPFIKIAAARLDAETKERNP